MQTTSGINRSTQALDAIPVLSFEDLVFQTMSARIIDADNSVDPIQHAEDLEVYKKGEIRPSTFDHLMSKTLTEYQEQIDWEAMMDGRDFESDTESQDGEGSSSASSGRKLPVCEKYLRNECSLLSCPSAHPGLRDDATIMHCRHAILTSILSY